MKASTTNAVYCEIQAKWCKKLTITKNRTKLIQVLNDMNEIQPHSHCYILPFSAGAKPKIITSMKDVRITSPKPATLSCEINPGDPLASIQWYKGGREVKAGRKYEVTYANKVASLVIKDTSLEDEAVYMCSADNKVGRDETEAKLTVLGKCCF